LPGVAAKWNATDSIFFMKQPRKIVVEAIIHAPVEVVWERTQTPDRHVAWDIRFTDIQYLEATDERGFNLMDYRTDVCFGIEVQGIGRYLQNSPPHHSTFEFESGDWKSIITLGRGIWLYEPCAEGTYFKTVYDYGIRYGFVGRTLDALLFRNLMRVATEWGFETLRLWCAGDESVLAKRRSRLRFIKFFLGRLAGKRPAEGAARSWLGSGQESELRQSAEV
jgi:hypothetical protein